MSSVRDMMFVLRNSDKMTHPLEIIPLFNKVVRPAHYNKNDRFTYNGSFPKVVPVLPITLEKTDYLMDILINYVVSAKIDGVNTKLYYCDTYKQLYLIFKNMVFPYATLHDPSKLPFGGGDAVFDCERDNKGVFHIYDIYVWNSKWVTDILQDRVLLIERLIKDFNLFARDGHNIDTVRIKHMYSHRRGDDITAHLNMLKTYMETLNIKEDGVIFTNGGRSVQSKPIKCLKLKPRHDQTIDFKIRSSQWRNHYYLMAMTRGNKLKRAKHIIGYNIDMVKLDDTYKDGEIVEFGFKHNTFYPIRKRPLKRNANFETTVKSNFNIMNNKKYPKDYAAFIDIVDSINKSGKFTSVSEFIDITHEFPYKSKSELYSKGQLFDNLKDYVEKGAGADELTLSDTPFNIRNVNIPVKLLRSYDKHEKFANIVYTDSQYEEFNVLSDLFTNIEIERVRCTIKNKPSARDAYYTNRRGYINDIKHQKKEITYHNLREALFRDRNVKECTSHRPNMITKFLGGVKRVFDPFAGWGDRMLGVLATTDTKYFGVDKNKHLEEGHEDILDRFDEKYRANIIYKDILEVSDDDFPPEFKSYDMVFTSPPYFDYETYGDDVESGLGSSYENDEKWSQEFLHPVLDLCWKNLDQNGHMYINLSHTAPGQMYINRMLVYMENNFKDSFYKGVITYSDHKFSNPQPIWIW